MSNPPPPEHPARAAELLRFDHVSRPFVLALDGASGNGSRLECREVVRIVPGRRMVCRGDWRGQTVF
ncbi:MAG TPA: hypothetical protein VET88_12775, partial [Gammaproteobacteria bacterium]|nr:hypothetical protein [Gammaproteobacteria bacterium]